ncbi:unnamed protein product [Allacma fusca]|uniref:SCP domain-containing protein n=1 Tax=Allacma fusca TaxID=39272 RepID=A0A8J2MB85_9HEXA|nr:unnamed protein product [Allacma fusca]CAG7835356.1 unnamed protein product [Allacma fusca]
MLLFLLGIFSLSIFPIIIADGDSGLKLIVAKTTRYGGYITKAFEVDDECTEIFEPWGNTYNRWNLKIVGKCVAVFKSPNCQGVSTFLMKENKPTFREYMKKIHVYSVQQCNNKISSDRVTRRPAILPLLADRSFAHHVERKTNTGGLINREILPQDPLPAVKPLRLALPKRDSFVTFYTRRGFRGVRYTTVINKRCVDLPVFYQRRVTSLKNLKDCIRLYEEVNCGGRSVQILPDDALKQNLALANFDNFARSFGTCEDFQRLGLELNNYYRALHNSPPLQMRESLNNAAQLMAEYLATQPALPVPKGFVSAELFYATNNGPENTLALVREAFESWYGAKELYDWDNPVASRFTQLIWKNTRYFGLGTARLGNRSVVVANYYPRGNYPGEFKDNVLRSDTDK